VFFGAFNAPARRHLGLQEPQALFQGLMTRIVKPNIVQVMLENNLYALMKKNLGSRQF
jgi:hypothetical protein